VSVSIRAAAEGDLEFLAQLYADEDVRPFLAAAGSYDADGIAEKIAQDPGQGGLLVVELDGEPAGAMGWELRNHRSRIVHVSGLAVHPAHRGRRIADEAARLLQHHLIRELGFHRIELEIYGFNVRAQRHAERAGFVREGVKRKAYAGTDGWVDGVLYALVAEDLDDPREALSRSPVRGRSPRRLYTLSSSSRIATNPA
jgi:RimJ/RimL family protein N-acetyltransferase